MFIDKNFIGFARSLSHFFLARDAIQGNSRQCRFGKSIIHRIFRLTVFRLTFFPLHGTGFCLHVTPIFDQKYDRFKLFSTIWNEVQLYKTFTCRVLFIAKIPFLSIENRKLAVTKSVMSRYPFSVTTIWIKIWYKVIRFSKIWYKVQYKVYKV